MDLTLMPWAWVGDHVFGCWPLAPWAWSFGPWCLALGAFGSLVPAGSLPLALAWALVLGYVSAGASFSVWRRVLLSAHAACKPTICVLMLLL